MPLPIASNEFPAVGTSEWDTLTQRRAELIHKKNREGLTEEERVAFEQLQRLSRAAIGRAFPHSLSDSGEVISGESDSPVSETES